MLGSFSVAMVVVVAHLDSHGILPGGADRCIPDLCALAHVACRLGAVHCVYSA